LKLTLELAAYLLLWSAFILWTVRKLWRSPDDPAKALFYKGVKALSLFGTIGFAAIFPTMVVLPALSYWEAVVYWAVIVFPFASWGMYFGLRWFHAVVGR
jgi:hypothetical protein